MSSTGSVGEKVQFYPGYGGYISAAEIQDIPIKVGLQKRDPNAFKIPPKIASMDTLDKNPLTATTNLQTYKLKSETVYQQDISTEKPLGKMLTFKPQTFKRTIRKPLNGTTIYKSDYCSLIRRSPSPKVPNEKLNRNVSVHTMKYQTLKFHTTTPKTTYQIDIGQRNENPLNRFKNTTSVTLASTTRDLARGTVKYTDHIPGYCGHIPSDPSLIKREDEVRKHAKDFLRLTASHNIPGYAGYTPHSVVNDRGPVRPTTLTTTGSDFVKHERLMHDPAEHYPRKNVSKHFFVQGESKDGQDRAQMFYKYYRPFEGELKLGEKSSRAWIDDATLKQTHIFQSDPIST